MVTVFLQAQFQQLETPFPQSERARKKKQNRMFFFDGTVTQNQKIFSFSNHSMNFAHGSHVFLCQNQTQEKSIHFIFLFFFQTAASTLRKASTSAYKGSFGVTSSVVGGKGKP
jgi:hypothetical protein